VRECDDFVVESSRQVRVSADNDVVRPYVLMSANAESRQGTLHEQLVAHPPRHLTRNIRNGAERIKIQERVVKLNLSTDEKPWKA
jgi:hypothetical protein